MVLRAEGLLWIVVTFQSFFYAGAYIKAVCFAAWPRAAAGEEESFLPGHGKLRCSFPVNTFVTDTGL